MARSLRLLALSALLLSARSFAWTEPDCAVVVWSEAHGHYHCVDDARHEPVGYYDPRPVSAPRIYVDLSLNRYPAGWHRYGNPWRWYRPVPYFYVPARHYHSRYRHHRY